MRKHMLLKKTSAFLLAVSLTVYGGTGGLNLRNMWNVLVEAAEIIQTGSCGESATYTLDSDGVLTITGTGVVALDDDLSTSGLIKKIVIEDKITSIGYGAFRGCSSLTDIVIPDSVTSIGINAFSGCSSLTDIVIPDSVTSVGSFAFSGCSSLTDIVIPDSVTSIGINAFSGCSSLTDIVIPHSVTEIDSSAFDGCSSLTDIQVDVSNPQFTSDNGVLFNHDITTLICCPAGKSGSYSIPDSVSSIGWNAFYGCSSLTDIVIPDSVSSIGSRAFYGCSSLTDIQVDVSNPQFTSDNGVLFNHDITTLICCPAGKSGSYSIPDSVSSIGSRAFEDCSSLTDIVIPDSVSSIGSRAFFGCSSLTDIVIPDSVIEIDFCAFFGCSSLAIIEIPNTVKRIGSYAIGYEAYDSETDTDIKIPNFTIYGFLDSEAERYANDEDFNFVPLLTTTEGITVALEDEETAKAASALTLTTKEITDTATDTSVDYRLLDELIENTAKTLTPDAAADVTYKAYDIVLLDADGHQTQPQGSISVRIPLPSGYKADTCHIYRLEEDNTFTDMKATCSNNMLTFWTTHFNIYVITEQTLEDASALISGDVNGDGEVDIADALLISRYDAKLAEFDATQLAYADVNDDNEVNIADALLISRYDAKLIDSLSGK